MRPCKQALFCPNHCFKSPTRLSKSVDAVFISFYRLDPFLNDLEVRFFLAGDACAIVLLT